MYALRNQISDLKAYDEVIKYALDSEGKLRRRWSQAVEVPKNEEGSKKDTPEDKVKDVTEEQMMISSRKHQ